MPQKTHIITIDGPAASGKSSASRELAKRLNHELQKQRAASAATPSAPPASAATPSAPVAAPCWNWLSTGAFYRAVAYTALQDPSLKNELRQRIKKQEHDDALFEAAQKSSQVHNYLRSQSKTPQELEQDEIAQPLAEHAKSKKWEIKLAPTCTAIFYKGEDVTHKTQDAHQFSRSISAEEAEKLQKDLRKEGADIDIDVKSAPEPIGAVASYISQYPGVRSALLQKQRDCALQGPLIAEGRDCGTVIFPQADYKFYLTANSRSRARRRAKETGQKVPLPLMGRNHEALLQNLDQEKRPLITPPRLVDNIEIENQQRDARDSLRAAAPLKKAPGAIEIDTSQLKLDEVVEKMYTQVKEAINWSNRS